MCKFQKSSKASCNMFGSNRFRCNIVHLNLYQKTRQMSQLQNHFHLREYFRTCEECYSPNPFSYRNSQILLSCYTRMDDPLDQVCLIFISMIIQCVNHSVKVILDERNETKSLTFYMDSIRQIENSNFSHAFKSGQHELMYVSLRYLHHLFIF